jgi:uncharacterized protein (TIGR02266 family)
MGRFAQLEKRQFLHEMSRGVSTQTADWGTFGKVFLLFAAILTFLVLMVYLVKNHTRLKGRWIMWRKKMAGKVVGGDRYSSQVEVVLNIAHGRGRIERSTTANISPGGMFVKLNPPLERDDFFRFRLNLTNDKPVTGTAEVMWVHDRWSEKFPTGIGVRFKDLSETDRNRIRLWIQKNRLPKR